MALVIQTNVGSLLAQKNLNKTQTSLQKSFNSLSSGYRINSAADDAAGLGISTNMSAQIRSYTVAERNANDGISMAQTAEGALGEVTGVLQRMRELAVQGSNGSLGATDRQFLETEFSQLKSEIFRIQSSTKFNGKSLVTNGTAETVSFQVGIYSAASDRIQVNFNGVGLSTGGTVTGTGGTALVSDLNTIHVSGAGGDVAQTAISVIDNAITAVSTARARFGASMNRLQATTQNLQTSRLNTSAANSRLADVDVAEETAQLSRNQVLSQAGAAVLAQANQAPQLAINLLR